MSAARLRLPVGDYALDAPEEVLRVVRILYPHSLVDRPAGAPARRSFRIETAAGGWRLLEDGRSHGEEGTALRIALALEYAIETAVVRDCGERVAFHAGAVGVAEKAVLLAGPPDVGKTSCTFELVEMGHAFLAEEVALVDAGSGAVLPYLQTLSLDGRLLEGGAGGGGGRRRRPRAGEAIELEPGHWRYLPARVAEGPLPLAALLLPRYAPGEQARAERLAPEDSLTEVLAYCFEPPGEPEAFFDRVIGLLSRTPPVRVVYSDGASARAMLAELLAGC